MDIEDVIERLNEAVMPGKELPHVEIEVQARGGEVMGFGVIHAIEPRQPETGEPYIVIVTKISL